jgi:hypothetical protein
MWITLLKRCGKIVVFSVDSDLKILLITNEYSGHERYGRIDDRAGNSAA